MEILEERLLLVAIGLLPVLLSAWFLAPHYTSYFILAYVVSVLGCFKWMSSGRMERYLVCIDFNKGTIAAQDRVQKLQMWVDDFNPSWVRISEIQVVIRGEVYRHPALVYSEVPIDLAMDGVPSSTRILLGIGEQEELSEVYSILNGD